VYIQLNFPLQYIFLWFIYIYIYIHIYYNITSEWDYEKHIGTFVEHYVLFILSWACLMSFRPNFARSETHLYYPHFQYASLCINDHKPYLWLVPKELIWNKRARGKATQKKCLSLLKVSVHFFFFFLEGKHF
jgi:hypothetical protein